ncbi:hypothetical protein NEDG_01739 [Nematocida displodere]|uniref:Uncharacterized protein n=1 Tax=Nematocida displodere TaxID=1805483 RepID=A0A177EEL8_9MICR|nr:hypothetical protein NEDG_01739 [Nematocida displodere]
MNENLISVISIIVIVFCIGAILFIKRKKELPLPPINTGNRSRESLLHAKATDAFLRKYTNKVVIKTVDTDSGPKKIYTVFLRLAFMSLKLSDIPVKIETELEIGEIVLYAPGSTLATESAKIAKLLQAFGGVHIKTLYIAFFMVVGVAPRLPRKIPLSLGTLQIIKTGSPLFKWFCENVDLTRSTEDTTVTLLDCDLTTIAPLEQLGIQKISTMQVLDMPKLKKADFHIPVAGARETLRLRSYPSVMDVPEDIARTITEAPWKMVTLDLGIWDVLSRSTESGVPVGRAELLTLHVGDLKGFGVNVTSGKHIPMRFKMVSLCNHEHMSQGAPFIEFVMKWVYANATEAEIVDIRVGNDKKKDMELVKQLEGPSLVNVERLPALTLFKVQYQDQVFVWKKESSQ